MRRFSFQCWSVIFLLVSRLVFGEFAHASPHDMHAAAPVIHSAQVADAAQSAQEHCGKHATGSATQAADGTMEHGSAHGAAHDGTPAHDASCCDTGACECLCVHVSAAIAPMLALHLILVDQGRIPAFAADLEQERLSGLFRPPA